MECLRTDCKNKGEKCYLCFTKDQFYLSAVKEPVIKKAKETKRKGSKFEMVNSNNNNDLLMGSSLTPNSGAGKIKGDERIRGYLSIMEELKEQNSTNSKGEKTFTIHKEWLEKLNREARAENKEFWYLKFAFSTEDAMNSIHYSIIDVAQLMSMIKTMWEDRKTAKLAKSKIDLAEARANFAEANNLKLISELELLNSELRLLKEEQQLT